MAENNSRVQGFAEASWDPDKVSYNEAGGQKSHQLRQQEKEARKTERENIEYGASQVNSINEADKHAHAYARSSNQAPWESRDDQNMGRWIQFGSQGMAYDLHSDRATIKDLNLQRAEYSGRHEGKGEVIFEKPEGESTSEENKGSQKTASGDQKKGRS